MQHYSTGRGFDRVIEPHTVAASPREMPTVVERWPSHVVGAAPLVWYPQKRSFFNWKRLFGWTA